LSALEKGTGFELKIVELFEKNGYRVTHDIKMKGKSGTTHQIDVLAEFKSPLHTSIIIIEAKSYQSNIDKDIIMKLIQIQQDLSADRAILATTSDFTPGALTTADQYNNLELWDGEKIASFLGKMQLMDTGDVMQESKPTAKKMVTALVSSEQITQYANETIEKRSKGGFMGKGKIIENVVGVKKFLYPYYDVDMDAKIRKEEKTGWRSTEESIQTISSRTGVDAVTGALIHLDTKGVDYFFSYLSKLDEEEIRLLRYVAKIKLFEKRNLSALGWSAGKIGKIVNSLCGKGVLQQTNARPATYGKVYQYPLDPSDFQSIMEEYQVIPFDSDDKTIEPEISPASIETAFSRYWDGCKINSIDVVYYPYYAIAYGKEDGTKRIEVIDGMNGNRQEYLDALIPSSFFD
jgi:hypothetical protein